MGAHLLTVFRKDLKRRIRSPLPAVVFLAFPIVFSLLIGVTFGEQGENLAPVRIALVDDDGGILARLLRSAFSQGGAQTRFQVEMADSAEAIALVEGNKVSAALRIPTGFTDSLMSGGTTCLEVTKNPAQGIYPRVVEQTAGILAQLGSAGLAILDEPVRQIRHSMEADSAPSPRFVAAVSVSIQRRMEAVARYALPPAVRLETVRAEAEGDGGGSSMQVAAFVLPGMSVFALLMLALIMTSDFQREKVRGLMARQYVAPVPFVAVILGKIGATWVVALICTLLLALLGALWAAPGVDLGGFVLLSAAFALAAAGFGVFVQSVSPTERAGSAFGSILVMIMAMLGGSWVPMEVMPPFVRSIAPFTLTWWGNDGYRSLLFRDATLLDLWPHLLVLMGIGALLTALSLVFFQRWFRRGA